MSVILSSREVVYPSKHWGRHPLPGQTPQADNPPRQTPPRQALPGQTPPWANNPPGQTPPTDGYCSGWYASYWNAFLFRYACTTIYTAVMMSCIALIFFMGEVLRLWGCSGLSIIDSKSAEPYLIQIRCQLPTMLCSFISYYRPQRSCGQGYVFTRVCDSVHRGCLPLCMLGYHPQEETPPTKRQRSRHIPPPRHTVNERPVRILLECILVFYIAFGANVAPFNRGFHKLSAIQECQYCQLHFSCAIRKKLDQWSLQPWNAILLHWLKFNLIFTNLMCCK